MSLTTSSPRLLTLLAILVSLGCGSGSGGDEAAESGDETSAAESGCEEEGESCGFPAGLGAFPVHIVDFTIDEEALKTLLEETTETESVIVAMTLNGQTLEGVELELHGGFAKGVPKKSFRIEIPDDLEFYPNLFGDGAEKQRRAVFNASWIDPSFQRHKLTMDLNRAEGGHAPRVAYTTLAFNGEIYGFFQVIERIDKLYLGRQDWRKSGNLYKAENHNANWQSKSDPLKGFDHEEGEDNSTEDLGALLDALTNTPTTQADFQESVAPLLDLENCLAGQRVHTFAMDQDSYTKNYFLYHDVKADPGDAEDRFRVIAWDADATFGNNWDGTPVSAAEQDLIGTDAFSPRLMELPEYKEAHLLAYQEALSGSFDSAALQETASSMAETIGPWARADLALWEREEVDFDEASADLVSVIGTRHTIVSAAVADALSE